MPRWFIWLASIGFLGLLARPASPQSTSFRGPIGGYVYSPSSRAVQPLLGVPGSTYLGASVMGAIDSASVAPDGQWALVAESGRNAFVRGLAEPSPTEVSVDGLTDGITRIAWSRDGSYALVYSSSGNALQRVRLSGAGATADPPLDVSPWGRVTTLAIDPAGQKIAFGIPGSGLYLVNVSQAPVLLSSMSRPVAAAFDDTGLRLYAADLDQQQIVSFDSNSGMLPFASLAQPDGTALDPAGIAVSGGGRYLLLADRATRAVLVYDIASQTLANTIPLDFAPSRLEALSSGPSFLLNGEHGGEWLMILDARQIPGVYFVPAVQEGRQ